MAVRELSSSPSLGAIYPRALAGPLLGRLPGFGGQALPDDELVVVNVPLERERVERYERVCGFQPSDAVPATYPHVLAFPLSMQLMTDRRFPFPAMGLVHIRNRIEQLRPLALDERLTLSVRAAGLAEHDRGRQFDVVAEAMAGGEAVWRDVSTYLRREHGGSDRGSSRERAAPPSPSAYWEVPEDVGRRYAAVSGDRNPIHLHALSARLFGFPRPIAHGMWLKARCLAALEASLEDAFAVETQFKLPLLLPGRVAFSRSEAASGIDFAVHDASSGKPHLSGSLRPSA